MKRSLARTTLVAATLLVGMPQLWAQQMGADTAKQIVGVWKLVSDVNTKDGVTKPGLAFGPNPNGRFIFTSNGYYTTVNTNPSLPKFASGNRMQGTADENKAIVQGSIAHFGTYKVSPDGKVLTLKVEGGTWPAWTGSEQKRNLTIKGDEMKYTVAASIGGTSELVYKRVK
jgi:Lipocalin-like domain